MFPDDFNLAPRRHATYDGRPRCVKQRRKKDSAAGIYYTIIMVYVSSLEKRLRLKFSEKMIREPVSFWESAGFVGEIQMR